MILIFAESEPPELVAVIVYSKIVEFTIGVPVMIPSNKVNPLGIDGFMFHEIISPPLTIGFKSAIAVPRVKIRLFNE